MQELSGASGIITATVTITRKATGETETYQLTGYASPEQIEQLAEGQYEEEQSQ
jgi:hypothetical protein